MYILGLNAFHGDSSAALIKDGELLAAAEEERFNRIKHFSGFPLNAIHYCLDHAGIGLSEVTDVAINTDSRVSWFPRAKYLSSSVPSLKLVLEKLRTRSKKTSIRDYFMQAFPGENFSAKIHYVEHHLAHLSSAFYESGFSESVNVSIDGFGDFASAAWGRSDNRSCVVDRRVYFPHSLGIFYQALTQFLGFSNYGDEYKVMGLAPYGKPTFIEALQKLVVEDSHRIFKLNLRYFRHHRHNVDITNHQGIPMFQSLFSEELRDLLGIEPRKAEEPLLSCHMDLAHSVQLRYEQIMFGLLNKLHQQYQCDNLTLSGGCAMNSVANGKIKHHTPFKRIYIPAAAGDAGGSVGAGYQVYALLNTNKKIIFKQSAYLGPEFSVDEIDSILEETKADLDEEGVSHRKYGSETDLVKEVAKCIADGLVVGWFQGRMEWGPRALGNRSILSDPRRSDMKDILNLKIKRRESFRPFAPSILREAVSDWFEDDDEVPFMMQVFKIKKDVRERIPAVTHVDGSGRLHTVSKSQNPRFHKLISAFHQLTEIPIVLNTSFNENEPVVCNPKEALDCFLRTKMDILVMNNVIIRRN